MFWWFTLPVVVIFFCLFFGFWNSISFKFLKLWDDILLTRKKVSNIRPGLVVEGWTMLSTGSISIQWRTKQVLKRLICWITLYPFHSPIHPLNNWAGSWLSQPFHSQDLISNSPYYLPYNSYVSSENLVLDQLIIPWLTFFSILITCLLDIVLIL